MTDIELWLRTWLAGQFPGCRVLTEIPIDLADIVPMIRVERIGGSNRYTLDRATLAVDCYVAQLGSSDGRNDARKLAESVRDAVYFDLPGVLPVTSVSTIAAPAFQPYDNPGVRCYAATYQLTVASVPAA